MCHLAQWVNEILCAGTLLSEYLTKWTINVVELLQCLYDSTIEWFCQICQLALDISRATMIRLRICIISTIVILMQYRDDLACYNEFWVPDSEYTNDGFLSDRDDWVFIDKCMSMRTQLIKCKFMQICQWRCRLIDSWSQGKFFINRQKERSIPNFDKKIQPTPEYQNMLLRYIIHFDYKKWFRLSIYDSVIWITNAS